MTEESSKYLQQDYDLPDFIKKDPHYSQFFKLEAEIVKNPNFNEKEEYPRAWGIKYENRKRIDYDYATFFEAYYDLDCDNYELWFSDEVLEEVFPNAKDDFFIGRKSRFGTRLITRNPADYWVKKLVEDYQEWQKTNSQIKDAEQFFTVENIVEVYQWLDKHPDFWYKVGQSHGALDWQTEGYLLQNFYCVPIMRSIKKVEEYPEWIAEGGRHVLQSDDSEYATTWYADLALDAEGETYDEALVNFAKNVWLQDHDLLKEKEAQRNEFLESLHNELKEDKEDD